MKTNYSECDGQISITDLLKSKIEVKKAKDLTSYINSKGKSQYNQVKEVVRDCCGRYGITDDREKIDRLTNEISVYILNMSSEYMDYLMKECNV